MHFSQLVLVEIMIVILQRSTLLPWSKNKVKISLRQKVLTFIAMYTIVITERHSICCVSLLEVATVTVESLFSRYKPEHGLQEVFFEVFKVHRQASRLSPSSQGTHCIHM